jgi:hypothetical protein
MLNRSRELPLLLLVLTVALAADDCRKDWAATWSFTPSRSIFTGNLTVTQTGCNVTERWWEKVTDWQCRGKWTTGWIEIERQYKAVGHEMIPRPKTVDDCSGSEGWRPSKMAMAADGSAANGTSEVWTRAPPAPPAPPLPSCLPLGECAIGFVHGGYGPPCCDGALLQQDYSSACQHAVGKHGYPESGLSCQSKACLTMGADCRPDPTGCCPGLSCQDLGISGMMCA